MDYRPLYLMLFNCVTDAIGALETGQAARARAS